MTDASRDARVEALLETPCWVLDFLPERVPAESPGQYFAVEAYLLRPEPLADLRRRMAGLLLRLNCYRDFQVLALPDGQWADNPPPERLARLVRDCVPQSPAGVQGLCVLLAADDALLQLRDDDLYISVYQPSPALRALLQSLAGAAGLFFRPAPED